MSALLDRGKEGSKCGKYGENGVWWGWRRWARSGEHAHFWLLVQYLSYGNRGEEVEEGTRKENVETQDLDKIGIKGKKRLEKADANQNAGKSIRVRILGNSYQEPYHQSIFVTAVYL